MCVCVCVCVCVCTVHVMLLLQFVMFAFIDYLHIVIILRGAGAPKYDVIQSHPLEKLERTAPS